jgi:hypothetical protein
LQFVFHPAANLHQLVAMEHQLPQVTLLPVQTPQLRKGPSTTSFRMCAASHFSFGLARHIGQGAGKIRRNVCFSVLIFKSSNISSCEKVQLLVSTTARPRRRRWPSHTTYAALANAKPAFRNVTVHRNSPTDEGRLVDWVIDTDDPCKSEIVYAQRRLRVYICATRLMASGGAFHVDYYHRTQQDCWKCTSWRSVISGGNAGKFPSRTVDHSE